MDLLTPLLLFPWLLRTREEKPLCYESRSRKGARILSARKSEEAEKPSVAPRTWIDEGAKWNTAHKKEGIF